MHKTLNKAQAIAILKASKGSAKSLWSAKEDENVVPLFSGGEVVSPSIFSKQDSEDKETGEAMQTQISPALLGGAEEESLSEEQKTDEERETALREEITAELKEQYTARIEELEAEVAAIALTARADGEEAGRQEGHEQGLLEGIAKGRAEGESETAEALNEQLKAHTELVAALQKERDEILSSARTDAVELAMRLTERLVGARLQKEDFLRSRLEQALEAVSDGVGDPIYVKVAPSQVEVFKAITSRSSMHETDIYIEPDEDVAVGDVIVESCGRRVSSVLKEQLERLEEVLYE